MVYGSPKVLCNRQKQSFYLPLPLFFPNIREVTPQAPMKILAADDNAVARMVLKAFLEKSGYEPVVVNDGEAALQALTAPDGPHIAILDWMMPGLSGPEVCTRLRGTQLAIRPYVILLTSKTDKSDIVQGLDAGADEFITKPFNQTEMLARLRAAQRVTRYETELQQRIEELASMIRRYEMRGDLIAHATEQLHTAGAHGEAQPTSGQEPSTQPSPGLTPEEMEAALRYSLINLGWTDLEIHHEVVETPYPAPPMLAWAGFFLEPTQLWLDLLMELKEEDAQILYSHTMQRQAPTERALLDFLAEALSLVQSSVKAHVESRDGGILAPFLSKAIRLGSLSQRLPVEGGPRDHFEIIAGGARFGFTLIQSPCPVRQKTAGQLNRGDILAEPLLPTEAYQIPLLNRGTILNDRFIERLVVLSQAEGSHIRIPLFEPTQLCRRFNPISSGRKLALDDED